MIVWLIVAFCAGGLLFHYAVYEPEVKRLRQEIDRLQELAEQGNDWKVRAERNASIMGHLLNEKQGK